MARSIKKFVNEGFFQTVDLDLLDRLLESYADRLPFRLSDLPKDQGRDGRLCTSASWRLTRRSRRNS